jgi:NAD-dependent deacetylase
MSSFSLEDKIQQTIELLGKSHNAVALTGAGISTPSGIPDFRSPNSGLWTQNDPMQSASLTVFRRNPERFFTWLHPLACKIFQAQPNPAHQALAGLEKAGFLSSVITQNIDHLHQLAGSTNVIEIHGSLASFECNFCRREFPSDPFLDSFIHQEILPKCPSCGRILKPGFTLFEESLPEDAWNQALWYCEHADVMLVVGTSLEVSPASSLPLYALDNHASLVINTYSSTYLDASASILLPGNVAEVLPQISAALL